MKLPDLAFVRRCRITLWLLAHTGELKSIIAAMASGATGPAEAGAIVSTIVSVVSTIHADLQNPNFEVGIGDLFSLGKEIEAATTTGGFTLAEFETAFEQTYHAIALIDNVLAASPAAPAGTSTPAATVATPTPTATPAAASTPAAAAPASRHPARRSPFAMLPLLASASTALEEIALIIWLRSLHPNAPLFALILVIAGMAWWKRAVLLAWYQSTVANRAAAAPGLTAAPNTAAMLLADRIAKVKRESQDALAKAEARLKAATDERDAIEKVVAEFDATEPAEPVA